MQFLTWIYDNADTQELLLTEWCIQKLKAAADTDTAQSTAKKRAARKYFCNELSKIICSIDRNNSETHPIFDSKISFEIFTQYMNTRKKKVTVQQDANGGSEEVDAYLSASMYDGMRSACKRSKRRFEAILWKTYLNILKGNGGLMPVTTSL